jgi:cytochrome c oxidase subunit 3
VSLAVAFGALLTGVVVWYLLARRLTTKSWEQHATNAVTSGTGAEFPPKRVGLWIFLAVVTSLFALFISAYYMRMGHGHGQATDWKPFSEPTVLWLNTALLIFGSIALQWARASVSRGQADRARDGLLIGGLLTCAFLAGQLFAWSEIRSSDLFSPSNPAVAFFYLLTAVHAAHLLGGLVVWARTLMRMRSKTVELIDVGMSVELCAIYWHYLLFVWLVLFALLLMN